MQILAPYPLESVRQGSAEVKLLCVFHLPAAAEVTRQKTEMSLGFCLLVFASGHSRAYSGVPVYLILYGLEFV
jgi:hypothetical protein